MLNNTTITLPQNQSFFNNSFHLGHNSGKECIIPELKRYRKIEYQWELIPRANDSSKTLSDKAIKILANAIGKLAKDEIISYTHSYLTTITKVKNDQNNNLLKQLTEILDIKFHKSVTLNGRKYFNRFTVSYAKNGKEILEDVKKYYISGDVLEDRIHTECETKKFGEQTEFFRSAIKIIKENNNIKLDDIDIDAKKNFLNFNSEKSNLVSSNFLNLSYQEKSKDIAEIKLTNPPCETEIVLKPQKMSFLEGKILTLTNFYPLSENDCYELQKSCKRKFSLNAMNEILLDMSHKLQNRVFECKKKFMVYMTKALVYEKRDEMKISNINFRIKANQLRKTPEKTVRQQEFRKKSEQIPEEYKPILPNDIWGEMRKALIHAYQYSRGLLNDEEKLSQIKHKIDSEKNLLVLIVPPWIYPGWIRNYLEPVICLNRFKDYSIEIVSEDHFENKTEKVQTNIPQKNINTGNKIKDTRVCQNLNISDIVSKIINPGDQLQMQEKQEKNDIQVVSEPDILHLHNKEETKLLQEIREEFIRSYGERETIMGFDEISKDVDFLNKKITFIAKNFLHKQIFIKNFVSLVQKVVERWKFTVEVKVKDIN